MRTEFQSIFLEQPRLKRLVDTIVGAGGKPYLVGGCVRDFCMGVGSHDLDIEVFGLSKELLENVLSRNFEVQWVGKQFGVYKLKGLPFDVAIPRTESKTGNKHTDFEVTLDPYLPLEKAALRRDFTINAIYYDLSNQNLIDSCNGLKDLEERVLRHTSDQFSEDPLRVYRAMQFIARFELNCAPETLALCRTMSADHLPIERVFGEFEKLILKGKSVRKGLEFLREVGWVRYFPELEALIDCEQDPKWHPEGDVWEHTLLCMDAFANRRLSNNDEEDLIVGLGVLCHDMGKPTTSYVEDGRIRSPRHDKEGVKFAESFLKRLTHNQKILESVPLLVAEHMAPYALYQSSVKDASIRRLSVRVKRIDRLIRVCIADREGRQDPWQPLPNPETDWLRERTESLDLKDKAPEPIIMGRDLIACGLKPGPQFKDILDICYEAQLDGDFDDYGTGLYFLKTYVLDS